MSKFFVSTAEQDMQDIKEIENSNVMIVERSSDRYYIKKSC
jgi:hypothetical protein